MADDEEAVVLACYKFNLLCYGVGSTSVTTFGKSEVNMSTPVHAVATPLNACRACRAVLSDKRDTARHDFFVCQNAWAR